MVGGEPAKQPAQSHSFALCFVLRHTSFFKLRLLGPKEQHAEVSRAGAPITRIAGFFFRKALPGTAYMQLQIVKTMGLRTGMPARIYTHKG